MKKLSKLMDVKSIVTLSLTGTFIVLALRGDVSGDFLTIYTTIIAFYFGTQYQKNEQEHDVSDLRYNKLNEGE